MRYILDADDGFGGKAKIVDVFCKDLQNVSRHLLISTRAMILGHCAIFESVNRLNVLGEYSTQDPTAHVDFSSAHLESR